MELITFPYSTTCPKCGHIMRLGEEEIKRKVHCQLCYHHYDYQTEKKKEGKIKS